MKCPACGMEIKEDAQFCGFCGGRFVVTQSINPVDRFPLPPPVPEKPPKNKSFNPLWLIAILLLVGMIGVGLAYFSFRIKYSDYFVKIANPPANDGSQVGGTEFVTPIVDITKPPTLAAVIAHDPTPITKIITSPPQNEEKLIFNHNFDASMVGFLDEIDQPNFKIYIKDQKLHMETSAQIFHVAVTNIPNENLTSGNMVIETDISFISGMGGDPGSGLGIGCQFQDEDNFIYSTIWFYGYAGIYVMNKGADYMIGGTLIPITKGKTYHLRFECDQNDYRLFIDGTETVRADSGNVDFSNNKGNALMLYNETSESFTHITFDNYVLYEIEK